MTAAAIRNDRLLAQPDVFEGLSGGEVAIEPESPSGVHIQPASRTRPGICSTAFPSSIPITPRARSAPEPGRDLRGAPVLLASSAGISGRPCGHDRRADPRAGRAAQLGGQPDPRGAGPPGRTARRKGAGLVSLRTAFPVPPPSRDPSYLTLGAGDWLAKLEAPFLGGRVRLLGYNNENELEAAAVATSLRRARRGTGSSGMPVLRGSSGPEWSGASWSTSPAGARAATRSRGGMSWTVGCDCRPRDRISVWPRGPKSDRVDEDASRCAAGTEPHLVRGGRW